MASKTQTANSGGMADRIVRAAGAQGVNQLARVVQLFLLVPICLSAWGTAVYEDWLLLYSVTAFLLLADLGFVQLTTVKLIDAWSRGEQERFAREWAFSLGVFATLAAALTCALGACWLAPSWTALIPTRQLHDVDLASVAVLLGLTQLFSVLVSLGLAAYRARGDLSRSYHVSSILVAVQTAGIAIPASVGGGPVAAALGTCIATGATLAAAALDIYFRYPEMTWRPIWPSLRELRRRGPDAIGYLVAPVTTTVMVNGPTLILAHSGAAQGAIALFTATRTIAGVARQLPYQFAHPAGVELAGLLARGDWTALSRAYERACRALAIIVGVLSGFTVIAAPLVMTLWTRGKVAYDLDLMLLLVGTTAVCAPAQVAYTLLWYGGHPRLLSKALIFSTGLAMGLAIVLAPRLGTHGVAIGLGVGEIVGVAGYLSLLVDRLLGRKAGTGLLLNFLTSLLSFLGSASLGYLIDRLIDPDGWFGLLELGFLWSVPAAVGLYWIVLSEGQKARVAAAVASLVRSRGRSRA